jgi:hypothetical protein
MAKVRQLFNAATVEAAKRQRICHHNRKKHAITMGQRCLILKDGQGGGSRNYCIACATEILDQAKVDLDVLRWELLAE